MNIAHADNLKYIPVNDRQTFLQKVIDISNFLQINPSWLMQVMYSESRINPQAKNVQKGRLIAAGLIQWTSASGETGAPASILLLNGLQQLDKVKKYFTPYRGKMKSYFDVYLVTFFPAAIGKPDNYVFQTSKYSAALIASQNPAVNKNGDKEITMAEFKQYVKDSVQKSAFQLVFGNSKPIISAAIILLFAVIAFIIYKK